MENIIETKQQKPVVKILLIVAAWLATLGIWFSDAINSLLTLASGDFRGLESTIALMLRSGFQKTIFNIAVILFAVFITVYCLKGKGKGLLAAFYGVLTVNFAVALILSLITLFTVFLQVQMAQLSFEDLIRILLDYAFSMGMCFISLVLSLVSMISVITGRGWHIFSIITSGFRIFDGMLSMATSLLGLISLIGLDSSVGVAISINSYASALVSSGACIFFFAVVLVFSILDKRSVAKKPLEVPSEEVSAE